MALAHRQTLNEKHMSRTDTFCEAHETQSNKLWIVWPELVVWATSMHRAESLRELAALNNSSRVRGVSSHCLREVWLLCTACCNPQSKRFTTFTSPNGNIWQFTEECLVAFNAQVSLSYNLFSFYWTETQFPEFLTGLANIIKLPWFLSNDFKKS